MYLMGEEDRPPLQISAPQAFLHAGAEASAASLIAHYPRQTSGAGQRVVVDMQACVAWTLMNAQAFPIMHGASMSRNGVYSGALRLRRKGVFRCADGHISVMFSGGAAASSAKAMVDWMDEKGFAADWMKQQNWRVWAPGVLSDASEEELRQVADVEDRIERFLLTMTRREIHAEGLRRRILLAPVNSVAEIAADEQLKAREFFVPVATGDPAAQPHHARAVCQAVVDADRAAVTAAASGRTQSRRLRSAAGSERGGNRDVARDWRNLSARSDGRWQIEPWPVFTCWISPGSRSARSSPSIWLTMAPT